MRIKFVYRLLIVFLLLGNGGFTQGISEAARDKCIQVVNAIQYSNDPDKLLFRYRCGGPNPDSWAIYELSSGRAYDFTVLNNATKNAINDSPTYSRDGKLITFVAGQDNHRNIFIMNADGSNVRQLTKDYNENLKEDGKDVVAMRLNAAPSFSPDGKRVIFARSGVKRQKPKHFLDPLLPSRWDIYEIEVETGKERRLTNYEFYSISKPSFLPDGKRFIFSAEMRIVVSDSESGINRKDQNRYRSKYKDNSIFIMDGENNVLEPILKNGRHSDDPQIAREGAVAFRSDVTDIDGLGRLGGIYYDLFVFYKGESKRVVNERYGDLHFTVSPDGTRVVFSYDSHANPHGGVAIINLDGTGRNTIRIPWRQLKKKTIQSDNKKQ
jgi:Tol biopolymer transport system component